ncbi:ATP-binding cassette domain-containing protein [Natrarchaeobius chitinivorans]|uniref:Sugar ABC transporter ATP-binding protein n=1 Tax=Natrarchaeobius chitinivorans TaxID=1679083 RepID=A0A3N6NCP5_NATCH|nr:ATP-binding cassette domain-containing protein [Natrarchaeobius chitinivorans]RQG96522.1 sugar ABC transporter ATP-binding protein [Natrarchaeobius chitinivorans]
MPDREVLITAEDITVTYGEVTALDGVDFRLNSQEIVGLVGDNGAGKSTLIKCLSGVTQPDSGEIRIKGEAANLSNPRDAKDKGIETAFQDLALADNMTVTQNIFLGREEVQHVGGILPFLDKGKMKQRTEELLDRVNIDISPDEKVKNLSGGERQLVAISRTLLSDPDIVILDEPTSALSVEGAEQVIDLIEGLREQGISIILISHNFEIVKRVVDRMQILYQGTNAGVLPSDAERDEIVSRMVAGQPQQTA